MYAALQAVREQAEGHEAVCVSHQLPIWTLRRYLERKRLWHDPRRRQCGLASLTSFHFDDATLVGIGVPRAGRPPGRPLARRPGRQGRLMRRLGARRCSCCRCCSLARAVRRRAAPTPADQRHQRSSRIESTASRRRS